MIRSYLFVPANNQYKMNKAVDSSADAVIFDLEDAVDFGSKKKARINIGEYIKNNNWSKYTIIRINSIDSEMYEEDLKVSLSKKVDAIMVPKVNSSDDILKVEKKIKEFSNLKPEIIPIIETVEGFHYVDQILAGSLHVKKIAFGVVDFLQDMNISDTHHSLTEYVKIKLSLASHLANKEKPIDSVNININNSEKLKIETLFSKEIGFFGKMAIHPNQVDIINKVFSLNEDEIKTAEEIVISFEKAMNMGEGAIKINGKMVDYPVYKQAKRLLNC